jgi:hypothetical protein
MSIKRARYEPERRSGPTHVESRSGAATRAAAAKEVKFQQSMDDDNARDRAGR